MSNLCLFQDFSFFCKQQLWTIILKAFQWIRMTYNKALIRRIRCRNLYQKGLCRSQEEKRSPCQLPGTHSLFLPFSPPSQASSCLGLLVFQAYLNIWLFVSTLCRHRSTPAAGRTEHCLVRKTFYWRQLSIKSFFDKLPCLQNISGLLELLMMVIKKCNISLQIIIVLYIKK